MTEKITRPKRQYDANGETFYVYKGYHISKSFYRKRVNGYSDWDGVTYPSCWHVKNIEGSNYNFIGSTLKECIEEIDCRIKRTEKIRSGK